MSLPVSSLAIAVQGIADFLDTFFEEDVTISIAHPQKAFETVKNAGTNNSGCLNLFVYRVAPSGFHADVGADQTQFIRINTLLTAFSSDPNNATDDAELRILGHAIRALHSHPVLPVERDTLPAGVNFLPDAVSDEPPEHVRYRLQAIMQAPPMEELNHIWTTQGGELAYRLSAAYEFALIPIEPLNPREEAEPPRTLMIDTGLGLNADGFTPPGNDSVAVPLSRAGPAPVGWLPVQMLVDGGQLTNSLTISDESEAVTLALAGPPGESGAVEVIWTLDDETSSAQPVQILAFGSPLLDSPAARIDLELEIPGNAKGGVIRTRAAKNGQPVSASPYTNALSLTVSP